MIVSVLAARFGLVSRHYSLLLIIIVAADATAKKLLIDGDLTQEGKGKGRLSDTTPLLSSVVSPRKTSGLPDDASGRRHPSLTDLSGSDPKHPHLRVHSDAHYPHHIPPTKAEVERCVYSTYTRLDCFLIL
jgi:hypothetical protein